MSNKVNTPFIQLFDAHSLDKIPWSQEPEGKRVRDYLIPLMRDGVHSYIDNVHTTIAILCIDDSLLPITINEGEYDNSYVCSPYAFYISYAKEWLNHQNNKLLKVGLNPLISLLGAFFKFTKINRVVVINNWLVSTNLYPSLTQKQIEAITLFLKEKFPLHAILWPSISSKITPLYFQTLKKQKCRLIAHRKIFFTDTQDLEKFQTRLYKSDLRHFQHSGYTVEDMNLNKVENIEYFIKLYRDLFIRKYSCLNPQFNNNFFDLTVRTGFLNYKVIKKDETIDGVVGCFSQKSMLFCPFFGYNQEKPQSAGLYRILSTVLMQEARRNQQIFHQSSGASMYKSLRKAEEDLEYLAVFDRHLPVSRKLSWKIAQIIYNSLGVYFMNRY